MFRPIFGFSQGPVSLGFLVLLTACAAQDAHRQYYKAQKLLVQAKALNPADPQVAEAEASMVNGQAALNKALYDQAFRSFKETIRLSEAVIQPPSLDKPSGLQPPPEPSPDVSAAPSIPPSPPVVESPLSLPTPKPVETQKDFEGRALPREALAKYLAGKRAAESLTPATITPKVDVKKTSKKPPVKAGAKEPDVGLEEVESEVAAQAANVLDLGEAAVSEGAVAAGEGVVKAQAAPLDKLTAPSESEVEAAKAKAKEIIKAPAAPKPRDVPKAIGDKPMTKIPGALRFSLNDSSIEAETMMNLDQTSKYLLENPSTTLILKGNLSAGEASSLVDSRFESLRSYLVGKGVPEDQIRLDAKRQSGGRSEFEMFIVEH